MCFKLLRISWQWKILENAIMWAQQSFDARRRWGKKGTKRYEIRNISWLLNSLPNKRVSGVSQRKILLHMKIGNEGKKDLNYEFMIWLNSEFFFFLGKGIDEDSTKFSCGYSLMSKVHQLSLGSTYCHQKFIMPTEFFIHIDPFVLIRARKIEESHRQRFVPSTLIHCTIIWTNFLRTQQDVKFYVLDNYPSGNDRNKI